MNGYRTNNMYKYKLTFTRKMCEKFDYHSMAKMWDVKCTPSKQNTVTSFLYVIKTRRIHFTIVWHRGKQKQKNRNKQNKKQTNKHSCSFFVFAQSTFILQSFILIENRTLKIHFMFVQVVGSFSYSPISLQLLDVSVTQ